MISFQPTEDQTLIIDTVAQLVGARVAPGVRAREAARGVEPELLAAATELALDGAGYGAASGGQGLGLLTALMIEEELAASDASVAFSLPGFMPFTVFLDTLLSEEPRAQRMPELLRGERLGALAWSEPKPCAERPGMVTTAVTAASGYRLTGEKCFVGNVERAEELLVLAQLQPEAGWAGLGAFTVPQQAPGVRLLGRHATVGLDAACFGAVRLDDVAVGPEALLGQGAALTARLAEAFARYSLHVAARQVGLTRGAFELMKGYAEVRKAFGKPIAQFQSIAFTIADRFIELESARELVRRAAWAWDVGKPAAQCLQWSAQAIATAHELGMRAAEDCVQLHGGAGFIRDVVAEKLMRDAKQLALCGYTAAQADQLAAGLGLGLALDPATSLPTPDTQAVFT